MSKLQDKLRLVKVYNNYEFFGNEPYIDWAPREARALTNSRWYVAKRGEKLSTEWYNHGDRVFNYVGGKDEKQAAFVEARDWADEKFGKRDWVRGPFGGYGDRAFVEKRTKELLARYQELLEAMALAGEPGRG